MSEDLAEEYLNELWSGYTKEQLAAPVKNLEVRSQKRFAILNPISTMNHAHSFNQSKYSKNHLPFHQTGR